jgi:hypothetical protein
MGLKLHSLQSVWTSRRLPEGNCTDTTGDLQFLNPVIYTKDPHLNTQITKLHALARQGGVDHIQQHIDAYLPAVAYLQEVDETDPNATTSHTIFARRMVLSIVDTPQLGTLPDLGPVIRSMLLMQGEAWGFILSPLYAALPCLTRKSTSSTPNITTETETHQAALCILLGLLLGIYPSSVKFPPFHVRVALYRRVHRLLTNGTGTAFCQKHPFLLTLAIMEYCAYVIPAYLPVEHGILAAEGVDGLFTTCALLCDTFRQEVLVTGEEDWSLLEAYCAPIVDRHTRACKSRSLLLACKPRQQELFQAVKLCRASVHHLPTLPIITPYAIHLDDPTHKIMGSEMQFLGLLDRLGDTMNESKPFKYEQAVALQRAIHIKPLPQNLTDIQIAALSVHMRKCERSAISGSVLYACMQCIMGGQQAINRKGKVFPTRGQCKLDFDTDSLICSVCHGHSIISISAVGRIISLKNNQFYLAPCCCTVQPYTAKGDEFQSSLTDTASTTNCHHRPYRTASKNTKRRCELCANIALVQPHEAVDHLTGEPHTTYLCQRHTPHEDALQHVVNWRMLETEIRRRDKPLFFHKRNAGPSGRRKGGNPE